MPAPRLADGQQASFRGGRCGAITRRRGHWSRVRRCQSARRGSISSSGRPVWGRGQARYRAAPTAAASACRVDRSQSLRWRRRERVALRTWAFAAHWVSVIDCAHALAVRRATRSASIGIDFSITRPFAQMILKSISWNDPGVGAGRLPPRAGGEPSVDAELLELVTQRAEGDAQRGRRLGLVVAALGERLLDRRAFDLFDVRGQRAGRGLARVERAG